MGWLEVYINPIGERNSYFIRDIGIVMNGKYKVVGSMPQLCIIDDRFRLDEQFRKCGTHKIVPGYRMIAQVLKEDKERRKFDYVILPGIVSSVHDPSKEEWVQLELPFDLSK